MSKWKEVKVSDVVEIIGGGTPKTTNPEFWDGNIPWLSIEDFNNDDRFVSKTVKTITDKGLEKSSTKLLNKGDLIISARGTVGKLAQLDKPMAFNQSCYGLRGKSQTINNGYLYYALKTAICSLQNAGHGAVFNTITRDTFEIVSIPVPSQDEQDEIENILGSLDQKIELNQRMNETLEGMARSIFKSWFVDFDPVHAKAEGRPPTGMDKSTAALFPDTFNDDGIPEGWKISNLGENFEIFDSKRIPLSSREREGRKGVYPYYGATSIMDYIDDFIFEGVHVLIGEDGSVVKEDGTPFMQYVWGQFWVNNHAHILKGLEPVCDEHIYLHLLNQNVTPYVTGAVQLKINQGNLKRIPFVRSTNEVCYAFAEYIKPLFSKIRANSEQNQNLALLRDTLLPKLISGDLRVEDTAEQLKEAVG